MVDQRLVEYVRQQKQAGYSDDQIQSALVSQGYPQSLIKTAIADASGKTSKSLLTGFVRAYRAQGYQDDQILSGLTQQGYSQTDAQNAIDAVNKPTSHHNGVALLLLPLLAIAIVVGGYLLFQDGDAGEPPIPLPKDDVRLGDIIEHLPLVAKENPNAAIALCDTVIDQDRQRCLLVVGQESGDPRYCEEIQDEWSRDLCYMRPYIYSGRYEYCGKLKVQTNIDYCSRVKAVSEDDVPVA